MNKLKPVYLVWDDDARRWSHNTSRDMGIYSSKAQEFFSRDDLDEAYSHGWSDGARGNVIFNSHVATERLIEHDGMPYKEE